MLLYPAMKDLLKNIPSRYLLVNIVAARARKISSEAEEEGIPLTEKAVTLAINEVAAGILRVDNAQVAESASQEQKEFLDASQSGDDDQQAFNGETGEELPTSEESE